jgi:carbon storage regulator
MLVLSRKHSESVVVGDPAGRSEEMLKITVIEITKSKVRLGFEAPDSIPVHRWEVWRQIHQSIEPGGVKPESRAV